MNSAILSKAIKLVHIPSANDNKKNLFLATYAKMALSELKRKCGLS